MLKKFPIIKINVKKAHLKESPEQFIKKALVLSLYSALALIITLFFMLAKFGGNMAILLPASVFVFVAALFFMMNYPLGVIRKREREIDREVLFAGRYLLVKVESGSPLFNALTAASKSYGVSAKYFKEIVDDINLGMPIEQALDNAREYSSSHKFKIILGELLTSLKTGADIRSSLKEVLDQITEEQLIEIKAYGRKLNAFMMIYMIVAVVVPSLGMTMFSVIAGFTSFQITPTFIFLALFAFFILQAFFLSVFRTIRPTVNI